MYPVFGIRGATLFLGVPEWIFGALLLREDVKRVSLPATESPRSDKVLTLRSLTWDVGSLGDKRLPLPHDFVPLVKSEEI